MTITPKVFTTEFPDFPAADLPALPPGFIDSSWRNDACPSMQNTDLSLHIFCDFADAAKREHTDAERFIIWALTADGSLDDGQGAILLTNDWAEVLALIDTKRPLPGSIVASIGPDEKIGG